MKSDMKNVLEKAFAAPKPKRKMEFIKSLEPPKISLFTFMLQQVSYIRKMVWVVSALISAGAFLCVDYIGRDCVWVISSMMPFIALCGITENARSKTYGMAELEQASRFSLKSVVLARMGIMSFLHLIIFLALIPFVGSKLISIEAENGILQTVQETIWNTEGVYLRTTIYLFVPYLLTSVLCLMVVRKMQGKELNYVCMGISVGVSLLNFILKANIPMLYEEKGFIWWCAFGIYLGAVLCGEYQKIICQAEEFV